MKILIIEDHAEVRATLRDVLEINGHEVLVAQDGEEGVRLAEQHPDFIFCDVQMPGLDGHGVLAAVKQMPGVSGVPFVFLTARAERDQQREGMASGADDYITKPFKEQDILEAIAARTKRHHGVRAQIEKLTEQHRREINARWSHELLTPLNAVMGSLELLDLEADSISRNELKDMLALIREGAERQERLARKLICYFSLEQKLQVPALGRRGLCRADDAIKAGATRAERHKNREGVLTLLAEPGDVSIDGELLAFAIGEVISNALNFSAPRGPVSVTGTNRAGSYRIEVADKGPGLTAEQRSSIGAFVQFDRDAREQQGLGLGLAIARATAMLAGGSVKLEAGPDGQGLSVVFNVPVVPAAD